MEKEQFYRGRFDEVGDRKLNSVRVFISSTFSDTTDERNGLIERVYPQLRKYCLNKYKIQFQYSDMRWGIQSTASTMHSTVDICLQELDSCSQLSMATNCVILLSHRYGSRLAPAHISYRVFQLLENSLSADIEAQTFLSQMYELDENYIEKKVFLKQAGDSQEWIPLENKLQLILRKAADICYQQKTITDEERNEFHMSVTAKEIYRTLKNNKNRPRRIVCFLREIIDIEELDSKYRETENEDEIKNLLDQTKNSLRQSLDSSDIYTYQVRWNDETAREKYFSQFFDDFYHAIKLQIDFHMKSQENQQKDILYNQILEHAIQSNLLTQRYFPRQDILEQIKNYMKSTSNRPCVLLGESGTGKSSVMAKLVSEIPNWYRQTNALSVITRFLGATPSSSDIRRPLISIIEQICHIYHLDIPSNLDNVKECLENIFIHIPKTEILVVLLDSIDQLQITDLKNLSIWLPTKFPSRNFKFIISTIPDIEIDRVTVDIHEKLRTIYDNDIIEVEINSLNQNLAGQVLDYWLERDHRCLTMAQREWIQEKFSKQQHFLTPLFVALLYDQTLSWHSYDTTPDPAFLAIKQTRGAIEYLFNQLGVKHGQMLFQRSMSYLQLSGGLSELELEDILTLDDEILKSIFVHYLPPFDLFRLPSTLWIRIKNDMHKYLVEKDIDNIPCIYFYHRSFQYYQTMDFKKLRLEHQTKELLEKTRLFYFANQYKETFDMSYSPKLANKYRLSTTIISANRRLTEQKPFKQKKTNQYNLRRLHQLYINLNRYDFVHEWTIFNYDFLSAFLLCGEYKMSNFLFEMSIGAHDPNGELRFLLKQFETSTEILDQHPNNLPFELIYRFFPFLNELPTLTCNLIDRCLTHCPLQLITNKERQESLAKCSLTNIISITIDAHYIFALTNNDKFYAFVYSYLGLLMAYEFDVIYKKKEPNERILSYLCQFPYVCFLTSNSSMVVGHCSKKEVSMQLPCKQLISFINDRMVLVSSSTANSLELWDCSNNILVSNHNFNDEIIENSMMKNSMIKVVLKGNSMISYIELDENFQFNPIRISNENINNHNHHILLDTHCEFYYSFSSSLASLVIYDKTNNNSKKVINDIDFISPPKSVIYLSKSNSIAWLTSTTLMIFHPLYEQNIFQPFYITSSTIPIDYDLVHDHCSSPEFEHLRSCLACANKSNSIIDIYEWQYDKDKQIHIYRQCTHLQLDISIDQFVFTAYWFDGITLYCSDGNNIYKYNATMLTYLTSSKPFHPSHTIDQIPSLHSNQFLAMQNKDNSLEVYTLDENDFLDLKCSIHSIVDYYFTTSPSLSSAAHILCVDEKNILSIYSLHSSKFLWTTKSFENKKLQIHSTQSSFILICLQTKQIFQIDTTKSCDLKILVQLNIDCHLSTISSNNLLYIISNDQKTLIEFNVNNQNMKSLSPIQLQSTKIIQLYSISDHLIFHTDDNQVYLWRNEKVPISKLEKASRLMLKHRLVLVCTDNKVLVLYDLKENLRGEIQLTHDAGQCEAISLSDYSNEGHQYLFTICSDRLLRMYNVSNGKQLAKLFINKDLYPFIGILNNRLLLKVTNQLCIIKIIDKKTLPNRSSNVKCTLFKESMWMTCHHDNCAWSNTTES
ncbi:unnamed protein product [Rotaria magnacalcarata]|uniref:NACHT domain-containing protein n=5 Tax=Rotaria magnacalcarata TaxID=392030 RepID=A0A815ATW6_9BILA|nr:unnamed protein product [Rotaria magnacalcarata]